MATLHKNQDQIANVVRIVSITKKKTIKQTGQIAPLEEWPAIEFTTDAEVDFVESMGVRYWIDDTDERFSLSDIEPVYVTADSGHFAYHAYKSFIEKRK